MSLQYLKYYFRRFHLTPLKVITSPLKYHMSYDNELFLISIMYEGRGGKRSVVAKAICCKPEVAGSRPYDVNEFFQFT
jgi:hypothetical protein